MAKQSAIAAERPSPFVRLRDYFQEVKVEMTKVAWPSKGELKQSTTIVLLVLAIFGAITFVYDYFFTHLVIGLLGLFG